MTDQELSGSAPHGGPDGPGAPSASSGDPKGSRTPGAGAAHERRGALNIETPPLSFGTPIFGTPPDIRFHPPASVPIASHNSGERLPSSDAADTGAGTPTSADPFFGSSRDISGGPVSPCDPMDPRPIWEQGLSGSHPSDHVHFWVPSAPGLHRRMMQDIRCVCGFAAFGFPTRVGPAAVMQERLPRRVRLRDWLLYFPMTVLLCFLAGWAMFFGGLAFLVLRRFR